MDTFFPAGIADFTTVIPGMAEVTIRQSDFVNPDAQEKRGRNGVTA